MAPSRFSQFESSSELSGQVNGQSNLSYREKQRLQQAQRNGPKRGATRGLKYISLKEKERITQEKPFANITDQMRRVVGENAGRFICECSLWVKEFCPLTSWNWTRMDEVAKQRLYEKIKANWNLPPLVDGKDVNLVLQSQCARLYRGWKYRLKERYFRGYSKSQAAANKPVEISDDAWRWLVYDFWGHRKQQHISEVNTRNRLKQTIKPANGALSTARIFYDMINAPTPPLDESQAQDPSQDPQSSTQSTQDEPICNTQGFWVFSEKRFNK